MTDTQTLWRDALAESLSTDVSEDLDAYASQLELKRSGTLDDRVFAEIRLRRGVYGQRYDNGQRYDGLRSRTLAYPTSATKGPGTLWYAPGMLRIKVPFGALNAGQLRLVADLAEEYSDDILHVTTRQDLQLHFIHIDDTPTLLRRLAAVGLTTQEACGNVVRNVTGCRWPGSAGRRRSTSRPTPPPCRDSSSGIPMPRTSAGSSRSRSRGAAPLPAAWRGCTIWASSPRRGRIPQARWREASRCL